MSSFSSSARKQARMMVQYQDDQLLDTRTYNGIMCGVVLAGLIVNAVLCRVCGNVLAYINPIVFLILYAVLAFAGTLIANKSDQPAISLLGYTMVVIPVGLVVSTSVYCYGGMDSSIVWTAFLMTSVIVASMAALSILFPAFFLGLGKMLLAALIGLILCELICLIFHINQSITAWIAAGIFSLYIGYDIQRAQQYPKTLDNAIDCALDIYLDIINLFLRILRILGSKSSNSSRNF